MEDFKCSVTRYRKDMYCISIRKDAVRYRFYNGEPIGEPDKPNLLPVKKREKVFQRLLIKYEVALRRGWSPENDNSDKNDIPKVLTYEYFNRVYEQKLTENLSPHFLKDLKSYLNRLVDCTDKYINEGVFQRMVEEHPKWSNTTFNTYVRYASIIEKSLASYGYQGSWSKKVKRRRSAERLHKKFTDVRLVIQFLLEFNKDLHLCALLTYGCLLRPHREIRELKWGDFNQELTQISLAGSRNKGKRNRIIPVPEYIREHLSGGDPNHNIFSGTDKPYNPYYFNLLWARFKTRYPQLIGAGQTLYSLRHTGAIYVYEKTKNIKILQTVMGHSDMTVSLTYLRGLDISRIEPEYLPNLHLESNKSND